MANAPPYPRPPSGVFDAPPCQDHAVRLGRLEERTDDHHERLADGDVHFAELRKDVAQVSTQVGALIRAAWWLIGVLALGVLGTAGSGLLWVVAHMGGKS